MTAYRKGASWIGRRAFMKTAVGASATLLLGAPAIRRARAANGPIVMATWGGTYADMLKEAIADPFTAKTGIEVRMVNTPDLAKVRAQITSGNVEWDLFDASGPMVMAGSKNGYWEEIDTSIVDTSKVITGVGPDRVPTNANVGGIAWNTEKQTKPPRVWAEFWDAERFPGRRALRNRVSETLEVALLADGVAPKELYPLDVERGFKSLDRIKPHVRKWFEQTPQMVTLPQSGEVDFIYAYPNRIHGAVKTNIPLDFSFDQTVGFLNYNTVLKGSKNKEAAMEYMNFMLLPETQASFGEKLSLAPIVQGAVEQISADVRKWIPDITIDKTALMSDDYWGEHYTDLDKRFKEWIIL